MESKEPVVKGIAYLFWNAEEGCMPFFFREGAGDGGVKNSNRRGGADESSIENS